jgi:hypothetical protein
LETAVPFLSKPVVSMCTTTAFVDIESQHFLHTQQLGNFRNNNNNNNNNYIVETDFTITFFSHLSDTLSRKMLSIAW